VRAVCDGLTADGPDRLGARGALRRRPGLQGRGGRGAALPAGHSPHARWRSGPSALLRVRAVAPGQSREVGCRVSCSPRARDLRFDLKIRQDPGASAVPHRVPPGLGGRGRAGRDPHSAAQTGDLARAGTSDPGRHRVGAAGGRGRAHRAAQRVFGLAGGHAPRHRGPGRRRPARSAGAHGPHDARDPQRQLRRRVLHVRRGGLGRRTGRSPPSREGPCTFCLVCGNDARPRRKRLVQATLGETVQQAFESSLCESRGDEAVFGAALTAEELFAVDDKKINTAVVYILPLLSKAQTVRAHATPAPTRFLAGPAVPRRAQHHVSHVALPPGHVRRR
jgi:hypothetical protein